MSEKKIKVESLDIIVTMIDGKPYYEIKYKEVGKRHYNIGYSSYNLDFVLEWKEECFEVVENKAAKDTHVLGKWISCSERLPEKPEIGSDGYIVQTRRVVQPFVGYWDGRKWTDEEDDVVDEVIAWMPLPEPMKEDD